MKLETKDVDVIIPVYNTKPKFLDFMLKSIERQTYQKMFTHILIVDDGSDAKDTQEWLRNQQKAGYDVRFREHKGIGATWNYGVRETKGDYIFIMGSDDAIHPTFLETVIYDMTEKIDVLGTYCIIMDDNHQCIRKWALQAASVYRRRIFDTYNIWFDEEKKKYIDVDHWERLRELHGRNTVLCGMEYLYYYRFHDKTSEHAGNVTEREDQLHLNRLRKEMHDQETQAVVLSPACPYHGVSIARLTGLNFLGPNEELEKQHRIIYHVGVFHPQSDGFFEAIHREGRINIVHWVGSDVPFWAKAPKDRLERLKANVDIHITEGKALQKELMQGLGIRADILPVPPRTMYSRMDLPKTFQVWVYGGLGRDEFYGKPMLREIEKETGYRFVYTEGIADELTKDTIVEQSSVIVRNTKHDGGIPLSIVEMLCAGRYAIWNGDAPFVDRADTKEEIIAALRSVSVRTQANKAGSEHYLKKYDPNVFIQKFYDYIIASKKKLDARGSV